MTFIITCIYTPVTVAYPGSRISERGVSALFVIIAHAQIVGRCGFERTYALVIVFSLGAGAS